MVIPWVGYSLAELIKRVEPRAAPSTWEFCDAGRQGHHALCGSRVLDWPYVEGLRMDEAMHPLTPGWRLACMARCCPTRTARPCAWWCHGSPVSRAPRAS